MYNLELGSVANLKTGFEILKNEYERTEKESKPWSL